MTVATQLARELAQRFRPIALLPYATATACLDAVRPASLHWAEQLSTLDDRAAKEIYQQLWPEPPPVDWWATPLGQAAAATGFDPELYVSQRAAARLTRRSRHWVRTTFGTGDVYLRDALDWYTL